MSDRSSAQSAVVLRGGKRIQVLLPDDGTDRRLMRALRGERGVNAVDSVAVRGVSMLREAVTKKGHLPEPELARLVTVIVASEDADGIFDFICATADINRPGGGWVMVGNLSGRTDFALPEGMPDEAE